MEAAELAARLHARLRQNSAEIQQRIDHPEQFLDAYMRDHLSGVLGVLALLDDMIDEELRAEPSEPAENRH